MKRIGFSANENVLFAIAFFIVFGVFSIFFFYIGIKHGFVDQRILGTLSGEYFHGKKAMGRGLFFIIVGTMFLLGDIITGIFLYKNLL